MYLGFVTLGFMSLWSVFIFGMELAFRLSFSLLWLLFGYIKLDG